MLLDIYVVEDGTKLKNRLDSAFKDDQKYIITGVKTDEILSDLKIIPDLIIINEDDISIDVIELCKKIRDHHENIISPIMVLTYIRDEEYRLNIYRHKVEYVLDANHSDEYLYYAIHNLMHLMANNRKMSPLTGLPGNLQIQLEINNRLMKRQKFTIFYFDLDNFKEYNDTYGFMKGDEVIKFTATSIITGIKNSNLKDSFVGHIGGDDFVAIVDEVDYDELAQNIIRTFDEGIKRYFDEETVKRGYLEIENRRGLIEKFPLTAISIGIVKADRDEYSNALEIGEIGAQMKHVAKSQTGSSYAINRRKYRK